LGKFSMPSVILLWIVEQPIVSFFVMRFMHACRKDTQRTGGQTRQADNRRLGRFDEI